LCTSFQELRTAYEVTKEGTPLYIPPLTYIVNKKIIKNPNEFSGYCKYCCFDRILKTADYFLI